LQAHESLPSAEDFDGHGFDRKIASLLFSRRRVCRDRRARRSERYKNAAYLLEAIRTHSLHHAINWEDGGTLYVALSSEGVHTINLLIEHGCAPGKLSTDELLEYIFDDVEENLICEDYFNFLVSAGFAITKDDTGGLVAEDDAGVLIVKKVETGSEQDPEE